MEEEIKKIIEQVKKSTVNPEEAKRYILTIKRRIERIYQDPEQENLEILQQYLEDYEDELKFRGDAETVYYKMLMYEAYKRLLGEFKSNKVNFDSVIRKARKMEEEDFRSSITIGTDLNAAMVSAVRYVIRRRHITKEKDIFEAIKEEKGIFAENVRKRMINIIKTSVMNLEDYGIIDEYIQASNEQLVQLGLDELQYVKRNPIPDEQYDENGKPINDTEDIGVIDTFTEENLMGIQLEDLGLMTAFWESKYLQARLGLSKAKSVIEQLDLWGVILEEDDNSIENLDNKKIKAALKRDLALTYLSNNKSEITGRVKKQYRKFLEEEEITYDIPLEDEIRQILPEVSNLEGMAKDVAILECLILHQLKSKDIKIKKWGIVEEKDKEEKENSEQEGITVAVENRNFRGPLIIQVPQYILEDFLHGAEKEFPKYDKELDPIYTDLMSKLYLPTNKYFNYTVKKAYENKPTSSLYADLAGKKVKEEEGR